MTMEANYVNVPFEAKFLRIVPKTWKNEIALKVMLFGCRVYQVPGTVLNFIKLLLMFRCYLTNII